jgi:nucleoside-diphosphate-sugar epimerase
MILITGSLGQIGVDLIRQLSAIHGADSIIATDVRHPDPGQLEGVKFEILDVTDAAALDELLSRYPFETVYHLAGILSARGEANPDLCWKVNVKGVENVLNAAKQGVFSIFWPSSIAVFGSNTEKTNTPQSAATDPFTMYGISKATGELLCRYYARVYDIDVRSLRFPGIISYSSPPGGGTTDFAVEMFFHALKNGTYTCFVSEETKLPMMYMSDAVKSILDLMRSDPQSISVRTSYNVTAFSFTAGELAAAIREHIPGFQCTFEPDFRQQIADTWPVSIDDSVARRDWGWSPLFDLSDMVRDMLEHIADRHGR